MADVTRSNELDDDFELFSSLRYDSILIQSAQNRALSGLSGQPSPFYMLLYHRDRVLDAAIHFGWEKVIIRLEGTQGCARLHQDLLDEVAKSCSKGRPEEPLRVRSEIFANQVIIANVSSRSVLGLTRLGR